MDSALIVNEGFSVRLLAKNQELVKRIKSLASIVAGTSCGIMGLDDWKKGLLFYVGAMIVTNLALTIRIRKISGTAIQKYKSEKKHQIAECFPNLSSIYLLDLVGCTTGYLLFWTLVYGILHVYK